MNKGFKIKHTSVEIIDNKQCVYDIYNGYKFKGVKLTTDLENNLEIFFEKTDGEWIKESDPNKVTFVFLGVKYLEFSKLFLLNSHQLLMNWDIKLPKTLIMIG